MARPTIPNSPMPSSVRQAEPPGRSRPYFNYRVLVAASTSGILPLLETVMRQDAACTLAAGQQGYHPGLPPPYVLRILAGIKEMHVRCWASHICCHNHLGVAGDGGWRRWNSCLRGVVLLLAFVANVSRGQSGDGTETTCPEIGRASCRERV